MEKLQAAIEKARAQRDASLAQQPQADARVEPEAPAPQDESAAVDLWTALPELRQNLKALKRHRVFMDASEQESGYYDRLRTKILQLCRDNGWTRVVVTSPTKACGKTTTCANLLASFSRQSDRKIIALDMDMRRPGLAPLMNVSDRTNFVSVLEGKAAFESSAVRIGDNVILAANTAPHRNPAQVILQDSTKRIIDDIQTRYQPDILLFDTPPLLSVDDTAALLKHVDCAMIVAGAELSTIEQVDLCEKEVAEQTNVLGVVLNRCNYVADSASYGYGY